MTHSPPTYSAACRVLLATTLLLMVGLLSAGAAPVDAVEDLRLALLDEFGELTPAVLEFRRVNLQKRLDGLKTIGELRRALALKEWKDDPNRVVVNKGLRDVDAELRAKVGQRLMAAVEYAVSKGDPNAKLAVANLIAEMGPTIRSTTGDRHGYARNLTPLVLTLVKDLDPRVRLEALRALGNIYAKSEDAIPVLEKVLHTDNFRDKRLAASSLGQLVRVVGHLASPGRAATGVEATKEEVLIAARDVARAAAAGMKDADPQVRALSYQALQVSATAVADMMRDGFPKKELPPEGRKLTDEERKTIFELHELVGREMREVQPALEAIKEQAGNLARGLADPELSVKLAAVQALESAGNARLRLKRRVLSVPVVVANGNGGDKGNRAALAEIDPLSGFLRDNLSAVTNLLNPDNDVRLRRGGVDFLDIVEESALPALPALLGALQDQDRFVRWAAARALNSMPPEKAVPAVPGLAKLLEDSDLNVRMAAANTLRGMGPLAREAAPALAQAVAIGDAEARIAAMYALQAFGVDNAKVAVPQLAEALAYQDPRVRRLAAETLGQLGGTAQGAIPALRRALSDDDADVRVNASEAMLAILLPAN